MGMFDMFEAAIENTIDERVKIGVQLLDDRIIALETGRVQSTFPGDVANALTEDQNEAVVRIVDEAMQNDVPTLVADGIAEADLDDAIQTWFDYNFDMESQISDYMSNTFDPTDYDCMTIDRFDPNDFDLVDSDALANEVSGINSRIDDLEGLADAVESLKDAASNDSSVDADTLQDTIEGIESRLSNIEEALSQIAAAALI